MMMKNESSMTMKITRRRQTFPWFLVLLALICLAPLQLAAQNLNQQMLKSERRQEYVWHFALMPLANFEANHHFGLENGDEKGYTPHHNALSVSGFRFKAINLWQREAARPNSVTYPAFMAGASLVDKAVFSWEQDSKDLGILVDIASVNLGVTQLSSGGLLHGQLEVAGHYGFQRPLQSEIGYYSYVSSFSDGKERTYRIWDGQWGAEARLQLGVRIAKHNYLNLHAGTRYQQPLSGNWYANQDISDWMLEDAALPAPSIPTGAPSRNAAFEGWGFHVGIGIETGVFPYLLGQLFDAADKDLK
ncbi:MAG: hypothetical protein RBS31_06360 [Candidatus Syntrophosphaera sp.]|jgi:hypothetical protein|nr:hypothetical protein [Candidatus Cloacimonadota bacterium]MDX9950077.1 hypothetical protein [Candidatus Syntrophosphaera sp.]